MRNLFVFLISLVAAVPATAGQRAVFAGSDGGRIEIEVADNGDARAGEAGKGDHVLMTGGHVYVVGDDARARRVVDIADVMAVIDGVVSPIFDDVLTRSLDGPQPLTAFRIMPSDARRSVGGREGQVFQVYGDDPAHPDQPVDWVISSDPALAPIGRALQGYLIAALLPEAVFRGPAAGERVAQLRRLFARGTPIVGGRGFTLQSITQADVPAARVALPAPPLTRAQLLAATRGGR